MTRAGYVAIARRLCEVRNRVPSGALISVETTVDVVADAIADVLAGDNPRFDRARFLAACRAKVTS